MRKWITVALVAAIVLAVIVGGMLWWRSAQQTDFQRAVSLAPPDSDRLTWTDWRAVRDELGADLSADSSTEDVTGFLDEGFEADLTSTSALLQSATVLHERYGVSPASVEWELFSQSEEGASIMLRLPESADFDDLGDTLEELGYNRRQRGHRCLEGRTDSARRDRARPDARAAVRRP